ncbi:hypothetical protein D9M69_434860 [compost metagenome]
MHVGALEQRHALAAQVAERLQRRVGRHADIDVGAHAGGKHQPRLQTGGTAHQRRQVALQREVELAVGQRLVDGGARALEEEPLDARAAGLERFLQPAACMRNRKRAAGKAGRRAGGRLRHADADHVGTRRRTRAERGQRRQRCGQAKAGPRRAAQQVAAAQSGLQCIGAVESGSGTGARGLHRADLLEVEDGSTISGAARGPERMIPALDIGMAHMERATANVQTWICDKRISASDLIR